VSSQGSKNRVFDPRILGALGVFAAGLLLTEVNVLSSRSYRRLDFSEEQRFSLSEPTKKLLQAIEAPVRVTVLLGSGDPSFIEARNLLATYRASSSNLSIDYIDPDRDTAKFLALSQKLSLGEEALAVDGISNVAFLVEGPSSNWFVRRNKLRSTTGDGAHEHSRMEAEISEAIARVTSGEPARICFTSGHGERSIDDAAPQGLLQFARRLQQTSIEAERVPFDVPDLQGVLQGCDAVAVIGPARPFPKAHERILSEAYQGGTALLLFLDPLLSPEGEAMSSGLEGLAESLGSKIMPGFVLESDTDHRLPEGVGESFFAIPKTHPITEGLSNDTTRLDARTLLVASQAVSISPDAAASALLTTSPEATLASNISTLETGDDEKGEYVLAAAHEGRARSVLVGSSNCLFNDSFQNPALYGNQVFSENAFSWALARSPIVSIPDQQRLRAGLNLSEGSLSDLLLYVLVYIPLAAASMGAWILLRRRRDEESSRREAPEQS